MNQRILAALREDDLRLFDDYTELHRVLHAGRQRPSTSSPSRARAGASSREWLVLGPFDNTANGGVARNDVHARDGRRSARYDERLSGRRTGGGAAAVRAASTSTPFYGRSAETCAASRSSGCAAMPSRRSTSPRRSDARCSRSAPRITPVQAWLNGEAGSSSQSAPVAPTPQRWPIHAARGRQPAAASRSARRRATGTSPPA